MEVEILAPKAGKYGHETEALLIFNFLQKYSLQAVQTMFGQTRNQEDRDFTTQWNNQRQNSWIL